MKNPTPPLVNDLLYLENTEPISIKFKTKQKIVFQHKKKKTDKQDSRTLSFND